MNSNLENLARLGVVLKVTFTTSQGDSFHGQADEVFQVRGGVVFVEYGYYGREDTSPGWHGVERPFHLLYGAVEGCTIIADAAPGPMGMMDIAAARIAPTALLLPSTRDRAGVLKAALQFFGLAND